MQKRRVGIWLVGARGGVATTVSVGLAALAKRAMNTTGLVTSATDFESAGLLEWDEIIVGGCDIRGGSLRESALELEANHGAIPPGSADKYADELAAIDKRITSGVLFRSGGAIDSMAEGSSFTQATTAREAIHQVSTDLISFRDDNQLERVIVVLLGSTEPPVEIDTAPETWEELVAKLDEPAETFPLRMSSLYAIAAFESGMPLVNFTPSLGASCQAIEELAKNKKIPHAGRDGKTGETLLKSVLAPMFAERQLDVMSWVSHNLLGNRDGQVLADPEHKTAKIQSKEQLLESLLGYEPQSHVSIEPISSMGDWKTAWDHIHFRGFMGVPMTMQFTWQGCDSALAAPLVIDLVRLVDHAASRGESGALKPLSAFFKTPPEGVTHSFADQMQLLRSWINDR